ncbi:DUF4435 domain-containing protein [Coleofasciculus chthonoplastes]|uniref:DUF4435 domain-containing protein n=1 Tax=Coleofasciculus chthonoplastes TaxID=64178 RepID=UPI0002D6ACE5|nr:DUF4435 domain-containing protein [Coleofasciculus chthonoplastes]
MRRSSHKGSFLIVEGRSDKLVYERFIDDRKCEFSIASGKENAVSAIRILEQDNFAGVLAIVDADFCRLEGSLPSSSNLLLTDEHDLEMMLIKSLALDKLLSERGSEYKINKFGQDIRLTLLERGTRIGYLRWVSWKANISLKFEGLSFSKFIDKSTLVIDTGQLIKTVKDNSRKSGLKEQDIQKSIETLEKTAPDSWQLCCGHDIICILSIGLSKVWGSWNTNEVKPDTLERELRLAYEDSYFHSTQLYQLIQQWEINNKPYQVLSPGN